MAALYLVVLFGVSAALLSVLFEAVWSVTRRPVWSVPRATALQPRLELVVSADRRTHALPFVGTDARRQEPEARTAQRPAHQR